MAFTEADRVQIRKYLGFAAIYLQAEPRLEQAITAVQSTADGGTRPDSSTEDAIKAQLVILQSISASILATLQCLGTLQVNKVETDNVRALAALRQQGWVEVGYLSDPLSTRPVRNVFGPPLSRDGSTEPAPLGGSW